MRLSGLLHLLLLLAVGYSPLARAEKSASVPLNANARAIAMTATEWGDREWDPQGKLLRVAEPRENPHSGRTNLYTVRTSAWYAVGLFVRNGKGDNARALETLDALLAQQYNAPGKPWDGTFRRTSEEPDPPANAVMWHDYDPNWREFIGVTLALILKEYPDRIPPALAQRMVASIVHAVAGELANHRLEATYTNPALMLGFLWDFAAVNGHRSDWIEPARAWQKSVYSLYKQYGAFNEFNSPTYCGVDLYALALWRKYGSSPGMRSMGRDMEASLWRNLAAFYNPNLKNLSGPFDRAYGMDMGNYVSLVGLALRTVFSPELAPFPKLDPPVNHVGDLWLAPQLAVLRMLIPPDAMRNFRTFAKPRLVRQQITSQRVATAWIGRSAMWGGEATERTFGVVGHSQFHPATIHWRMPNGKIGWIQLSQFPPLDAVANRDGLKITCNGDVQFLIHTDGIDVANIQGSEWKLPGLTVRVETDALHASTNQNGQDAEINYSSATTISLTVKPEEVTSSAHLVH